MLPHACVSLMSQMNDFRFAAEAKTRPPRCMNECQALSSLPPCPGMVSTSEELVNSQP